MTQVVGIPLGEHQAYVFTAPCHSGSSPRATVEGARISFTCVTCDRPVGSVTVTHAADARIEGAYLVSAK